MKTHRIKEDSFVVIYLNNPKEKFWGRLISLKPEGVQVKGLNINSFNDWLRNMSSINLSTVFFPMIRVEKIILDESSDSSLSFKDQVIKKTQKSPTELFNS
ncbi:MAG: hypothetical protein ACE5WD_04855 [Candidatus Aminicenantia bacterium]